MNLIPAICPNCGASLKVDIKEKAAICEYCHTAFIVDEAVNKYNTFQTTNIQHLHTDNVILNDSGVDKLLNAGHSLITLKKFWEADEQFSKACEQYPGDWRSWWGRVEVLDAGQQEEPGYIGGRVKLDADTVDRIVRECSENVRDLNGGQMPEQTLPVYSRISAHMKKYRDLVSQREQEIKQIEKKHEQLMAPLDQQYHKKTDEIHREIGRLKKEINQSWKEYHRVLTEWENLAMNGTTFIDFLKPALVFAAPLVALALLGKMGLPLKLVFFCAGLAFVAALAIAGWISHMKNKEWAVPQKACKRAEKEKEALERQILPTEKQYREAKDADAAACKKEIDAIRSKYADLYDAWEKEY